MLNTDSLNDIKNVVKFQEIPSASQQHFPVNHFY